MRRIFLGSYLLQGLGCLAVAAIAAGIHSGAQESRASEEWQRLKQEHHSWAASPMKVTCDGLWEAYESIPLGTGSCPELLESSSKEPPTAAYWRCNDELKARRQAAERELRSNACFKSAWLLYGGASMYSARAERYSPADPGSYEAWANDYAARNGLKRQRAVLALAVAMGSFALLQLCRLYLTEIHQGWKRAAVVAASAASALTVAYPFVGGASLDEWELAEALVSAVVAFLLALLVMLLSVRIVRWVSQGFQKTDKPVEPGG